MIFNGSIQETFNIYLSRCNLFRTESIRNLEAKNETKQKQQLEQIPGINIRVKRADIDRALTFSNTYKKPHDAYENKKYVEERLMNLYVPRVYDPLWYKH